MNQLLLGSGDWHWSGWTTLDANHVSGADVIATIPPLPESVMRQAWDRLLAAHFIEHLYLWQAKMLLQQCYKCLNVGGILTLEQPNIEYCAKVLLGQLDPPKGSEPGQFDMWGFYGTPLGHDPLMGHHWGYTPKSLSDLVVEAGFKQANIMISPGRYHQPDRDFTLEVVK